MFCFNIHERFLLTEELTTRSKKCETNESIGWRRNLSRAELIWSSLSRKKWNSFFVKQHFKVSQTQFRLRVVHQWRHAIINPSHIFWIRLNYYRHKILDPFHLYPWHHLLSTPKGLFIYIWRHAGWQILLNITFILYIRK